MEESNYGELGTTPDEILETMRELLASGTETIDINDGTACVMYKTIRRALPIAYIFVYVESVKINDRVYTIAPAINKVLMGLLNKYYEERTNELATCPISEVIAAFEKLTN